MDSVESYPVYELADIAIDPTIPSLRFRCDVKRCRGACCTIPGGRGAPLLDAEVEELQKALPAVERYLSPEHREVISRDGVFEGSPGGYHTTCVDHRACVFVFMEGEIAKCALEFAYLKGEIAWRKPLSCHLFPIRIDRGKQERVRFEYLIDCEPAYDHGAATGTYLSDFAAEPLARAYGKSWVKKFIDLCRRLRTDGEPSGEPE
ncbi:MAG TPA: DUF3109 family protein [Bacteroidota bacterium]|nr:DUF3109 family protein [Bacteroidota bacterium]